MNHSVFRLTEKIKKEPLLLEPDKLEDILGYLDNRNNTGIIEAAINQNTLRGETTMESSIEVENGFSVINMYGPTTYKPTFFQMLCGGLSYESIVADVTQAISLGASTILFSIDGPGGEAYRCFETGSEIRKLADDNDVKLIGYIDGRAASATYALSSVMHELYMNPDSEAGSIGVVTRLVNTNKADAEEGIETTYVTAGKSKVPFDKEGNFREEFIGDLQVKVDRLYENFVSHISEFRGMDPDVVKSTEAKMYTAEDALSLGLVDGVMTESEFINYLADPEVKGGSMAIKTSRIQISNEEVETEMSAEQLKTMEEEIKAMKAQLASEAKAKEELAAQLAETAKAKEEAELKAAKEIATAKAEELISGYSVVADEDKADLTTFLVNSQLGNIEGSEAVLNTLESYRKAVMEFATEEVGYEVEDVAETVQEANEINDLISKQLQARKK